MKPQRSTGQKTFLSFSGIDGAGKSTQIRALCASLSSLGLQTRVVPFWDEVACFARLRGNAGHIIFRGDRGIGSPSAPVQRRDKNVRVWPMTCLRLVLYLLDAMSVKRVFIRSRRSDVDVIVFDRYIYDELANLNLQNPIVRFYARIIVKLAPAPDIGFLLDADPHEARARKPEYPIEFMHFSRQSYKCLWQMVAGSICIPPMTIDNVHELILSRTLSAVTLQDYSKESVQDSSMVSRLETDKC